MPFILRELTGKTRLGEHLRQMRRRRALTLSQMSSITQIQEKYLRSLESCAWSELPEPVYVRQFIKRYVSDLGENPEYFIERYDEECGMCNFASQKHCLPRQRVSALRMLSAHRIFKIFLLAALAVAILTYVGIQINRVLSAPALTVIEPLDGLAVSDARAAVRGMAQEAASIKINGEQILPNPRGEFETIVDLERGLNVITIEARKRYSRPAVIYRTVVVDATGPASGGDVAFSLR